MFKNIYENIISLFKKKKEIDRSNEYKGLPMDSEKDMYLAQGETISYSNCIITLSDFVNIYSTLNKNKEEKIKGKGEIKK